MSSSKELVAKFKRGDVVRWNAPALHGTDRDGWTVDGMKERYGLFPVYHVRKGKDRGHAVQTDLEPMPVLKAVSNTVDTNIEIIRGMLDFAYEQGFHELGYDPLSELVSQLRLTSEPSTSAEARSNERRLQAYPKLAEFFEKYALGSKLPPSCFVCGDIVIDVGVQHMELLTVQCCKRCKDAADQARHIPPPNPCPHGNREDGCAGCDGSVP